MLSHLSAIDWEGLILQDTHTHIAHIHMYIHVRMYM